MPVDQLFVSLAEELQDRSIGVVLSGTGNDGTAGVQSIKQAGGFTFAQDESARFDGMPRSAISSQCVDAILPPAQIATELARICRTPRAPSAPEALLGDEEHLKGVFAALRDTTGVDFSGYKPSTLQRRISRRLAFNRLGSLAAYREFIEHNPGEVKALYEDLLIHVTGFFRDPGLFDALRTTVFPCLVEARPEDVPIRIWVPGCSTGEEVYSLAICVLEYLSNAGLARSVRLFGTDVSDSTIMRARAAVYTELAVSGVGPERLQRFFVPTEGGYQIRRDIRDMCVFARQDVTSDPPFSNMDLVSCRNLLIYLGQGLQSRVIAVLHYALKNTGYLVLGTSEGIATFPGFTLVDGKNRIFAKAPGAPRLLMDFPGSGLGAARPLSPRLLPLANQVDVNKEADRAIVARFGVPSVVITEDLTIVQFRGQTGPFLDPLPGVASLDLFKMAREEIRMDLRAAIDEARERGEIVVRKGLWMKSGDGLLRTDVEVLPIRVPVADQKL
ncbi:MAG: CheR family methyltransferase, partial [Deltaproteobacteria bacterium]